MAWTTEPCWCGTDKPCPSHITRRTPCDLLAAEEEFEELVGSLREQIEQGAAKVADRIYEGLIQRLRDAIDKESDDAVDH